VGLPKENTSREVFFVVSSGVERL